MVHNKGLKYLLIAAQLIENKENYENEKIKIDNEQFDDDHQTISEAVVFLKDCFHNKCLFTISNEETKEFVDKYIYTLIVNNDRSLFMPERIGVVFRKDHLNKCLCCSSYVVDNNHLSGHYYSSCCGSKKLFSYNRHNAADMNWITRIILNSNNYCVDCNAPLYNFIDTTADNFYVCTQCKKL
ncbi:hypothetical protein [Perigonia lusca single nucleopolyhedrovirus]|uniref:Uncharacterized protein n=1 Tax=Perigonia lusca single nucleopolyhedrovirus TaxID=1675865 RepID=A0A0M3WN68_9ABAC|nr:hypothetical protein [Perigonia lusca single nucleopolyhedrovirus]AKN80630.1 hypothetical protein [Perigonia lusca single nucleopolyhedrovirus]